MLKNQLLDLYASITMDVKKTNYLQDLYVGITMDIKNQKLFMKPICGYCIFEMTLWTL
jgi:hypothetical protein